MTFPTCSSNEPYSNYSIVTRELQKIKILKANDTVINLESGDPYIDSRLLNENRTCPELCGREVVVSKNRFLPFEKKPLSMKVSIENNRVEPKQKLRVQIFLQNGSSSTVKCIRIKLRRYFQDINKTELKEKKNSIKTVNYANADEFPLPSGEMFNGVLYFGIPLLTLSTSDQHQSHHKRAYELKIQCILGYLFKNVSVHVPLIVVI